MRKQLTGRYDLTAKGRDAPGFRGSRGRRWPFVCLHAGKSNGLDLLRQDIESRADAMGYNGTFNGMVRGWLLRDGLITITMDQS